MKKFLLFLKSNFEFVILFFGCIAFFFSSGRYNIPIFNWVWPFCFLFFFRYIKKTWYIVFPIFLQLLLGAFKWFPFFDEPDFFVFLIGPFLSFFGLISLLVDYFFYKKIKGFKATFLFPLTYVSIDLILSFTPLSSVVSIASTQSAFIVLAQSSSLFGCYFITFIVTWFPCVILYCVDNYKIDKKRIRAPIIIYASLFSSLMIYGGIRINTSNNLDTFKVALVSDFHEYDVDACLKKTSEYIKTSSSAKADMLIFSEEYITLKKDKEEVFINNLKKEACENNIYLLVGVEVEKENSLSENKTYLIDNNNNIVFTYYKNHLVPFDEMGRYKTGDNTIPNKVVKLPSGKEIKLASIICFDSDFNLFVRNKVDNDTGTLLVPTWDWLGVRKYHSENVIYRAIENGFSYVRATYDGITSVIDPYGRTTASYNTFDDGLGKVNFGEVTYKPIFTLYKYIGIVTDFLFPASLIFIITYQFVGNYYNKKKDKNNKSIE